MPDERAVLYTVGTTGSWDDAQIVGQSVASGERSVHFWSPWARRLGRPNLAENPPPDTQANGLNLLHASWSLAVPARKQPDLTIV